VPAIIFPVTQFTRHSGGMVLANSTGKDEERVEGWAVCVLHRAPSAPATCVTLRPCATRGKKRHRKKRTTEQGGK